MIKAFIKRNGILAVWLVVYIAGIVGFALALDIQIFQPRKREMIFEFRPDQLFPTLETTLRPLVNRWRTSVQRGTPGEREAALREFRAAARAIVQGPTAVFRVGLLDSGGVPLVDERMDKAADFNTFANCLWLRSFDVKRSVQLGATDGTSANIGTYFVWYATPRPAPPELDRAMRELVFFYRLLTLAVVAAFTALSAFFVFAMLIPMRNVTSAIAESEPELTRFVRRPWTSLERLYNAMAREIVLARLQERTLERITRDGLTSSWDLVQLACQYAADQRAAETALAVELQEEGPGAMRWTGRWTLARAEGLPPEADGEDLARALAAELGRRGAAQSGGPAGPAEEALHRRFARRLAADPDRPGVHYGLAISLGRSSRQARGGSADALLDRLTGIIRRGVEALAARQRTLVRERDRASINLSRNLGHDLTNIIATSKLELMTLGELLAKGAPPPEGARREILTETLDALMNSTRFLQEVVNLYRAYAYLKEPTLETHEANRLVEETINLFQLSSSKRVRFNSRLDPASPKFRVDPRLFKLAVFNLFSNALDAIRRGGQGDEGLGVIEVSTEGGPDGVRVAVRDNGPGILNERGEMAGPEEIERIFGLGYTLGRGKEGEGLGLNWVQTIVQDIHGGAIQAENAAEGGARFNLFFPTRFEAKDVGAS